MARISGMPPTFPYAFNSTEAPYSDGLISSAPEAKVPIEVSFPTFNTVNPVEGGIASTGTVEDYIGNTKCIYANQVWYPIFAGDF